MKQKLKMGGTRKMSVADKAKGGFAARRLNVNEKPMGMPKGRHIASRTKKVARYK